MFRRSSYTLKCVQLFVLILVACAVTSRAQTTSFTYQGSLKDGGVAANGNYDFEFVLFDALSGGTQLGSTIPQNSVAVSNGTFAVTLDFGNQYPGANRFLEIHVRQTGGASFTVLTPRQQIASAPYSVKSLNSENATNSTNSTNALQLGGVAANQYVVTGDTRLSDPRPPTAGSSNYIQNATTQQAASNFNISGNGTAAGTISGNVITAATQFNIGGNRVFITGGGGGTVGPNVNTFAGVGAGAVNNAFPDGTLGNLNTFFGGKAGGMNTVGRGNSFFGWSAGLTNIDGSNNSFFGAGTASAYSNVFGNSNSFFGSAAGAGLNGVTMSGSSNSFFGANSGVRNAAGNYNTFVGALTAPMNSTGDGNSFFGYFAGNTNTTGSSNTLIGRAADVGANNLTNATAIGANSQVAQSNSLVLGGITGVNGGTNTNVGIGTTAPNTALDITGAFSVRGSSAPPVAPAGQGRIYFDGSLGRLRVSQDGGAYGDLIGGAGGLSGSGTTGTVPLWNSSTALGDSAITQSGGNVGMGSANPTEPLVVSRNFASSTALTIENTSSGSSKKLFLLNYGINGSGNYWAGLDSANTSSLFAPNPFILRSPNGLIFSGSSTAEHLRITPSGNVGIGTSAPVGKLDVQNTEEYRWAASFSSTVPSGVSNGLTVAASSTVLDLRNHSGSFLFNVLGDGRVQIGTNNGTDTFTVNGSSTFTGPATFNGTVKVTNLPSGGFVLCVGNDYLLNLCGSSLRFKKNVNDFHAGLELANRLRPVTFDWKKDGTHDIGLIAEEVEAVDPLFATYFDGKLQGVKYDRISVVLINAVKEQQAQIEAQKAEIETLKAAICEIKPTSAVCKK